MYTLNVVYPTSGLVYVMWQVCKDVYTGCSGTSQPLDSFMLQGAFVFYPKDIKIIRNNELIISLSRLSKTDTKVMFPTKEIILNLQSVKTDFESIKKKNPITWLLRDPSHRSLPYSL